MEPNRNTDAEAVDPNEAPPGWNLRSGDAPWTIRVPEHPDRTDSATYRASRKTMNRLARTVDDLAYGPPPYEDHHGGGLWLKDDEGWFLVRNVVGIEWSGQFCADPAKVDSLRRNARRLYARFPEAVAELKIRKLLDTPITDAAGVAKWTDSMCNASLPLPRARHTGMLPKAPTGGVHHYPSPIAETDMYKRDDFPLWVTLENGAVAALAPVGAPGSGDGSTRLLLAAVPPETGFTNPYEALGIAEVQEGRRGAQEGEGDDPTLLPADHPLSILAFAQQNRG